MEKEFYLNNQGHLTDKPPIKEAFIKPSMNKKYDIYNKLYGGLWTSTIEYNTTEWCEFYKEAFGEDFNKKLYKLKIKSDCKILEVNVETFTNNEIEPYLSDLYPDSFTMKRRLDYEKVLNAGYDIVHVQPEFLFFNTNKEFYHMFYGYDCECSIILNYDIIEGYEEVKEYDPHYR